MIVRQPQHVLRRRWWAVRTLVIDNYDSYAYNIVQLLARVNGTQPAVLRNDDPAWPGLDLREFDNIVISPGPGHPGRHRDFGHSSSALACGLPVLGVCLGHRGGWCAQKATTWLT